jgi:hypothetical protein
MTTQTPVVAPDYGAMLNSYYVAQVKLVLGQSAVEVHDQNGERVVFTPANAGRLAGMIAWLEVKTGVHKRNTLHPLGAFF